MNAEEIKKNIRIVEVNTTAFEEENFILLTDLSDEQIEVVIKPIVDKERNASDDDDDTYYDNEELFGALEETYPNNIVIFYSDKGFDEITI
jgi:hypothetical protein